MREMKEEEAVDEGKQDRKNATARERSGVVNEQRGGDQPAAVGRGGRGKARAFDDTLCDL